jgi:DNA polymerase-3 subunit alpha
MGMLQLDDTRGLAEVIVFPRVYAKCAGSVREDAIVKVKGRVERKEGIPRIIAMDIDELHLEPGPDPVYLDAGAFVDRPRSLVYEAFAVIGRHPGESPLVLVSDDGIPEETICTVRDSSDLYAELKQILGPRCMSAVRQAPKPEVEQVS